MVNSERPLVLKPAFWVGAALPKLRLFASGSRFVLPIVMVAGLFGLILIIRQAAMFVLPAASNIFEPYAHMMPGASRLNLRSDACEIPYMPSQIQRKVVCVLVPEDGEFSAVTVTAEGNRITEVSFVVRSLRVIDMVWRWGRPDNIKRIKQRYELEWFYPTHVIARIEGLYSQNAMVKFISLSSAVVAK
jgi:hypothetical protein